MKDSIPSVTGSVTSKSWMLLMWRRHLRAGEADRLILNEGGLSCAGALRLVGRTQFAGAEIRAEEIRQNLIWMIGLPTILMGLFTLLFGCRIAKTVASMTATMR
ncbi:hypothetical protein ACVW0J_009630 [Bradyrhizobium sp. i1.7.7]